MKEGTENTWQQQRAFFFKVLPSSSDTFSEPSWQQSKGSDFLVKSFKLWKEVQAFCPSHIYTESVRCKQGPLTHEELHPLQTLSNCQRLQIVQQELQRSMWKVKGKQVISMFRSLRLQSYSQISAKHLGFFFFFRQIINLLLRSKSSEEPKDQLTKISAINNNLN